MTRRAIVQKWILYCLCALVLLAVQDLILVRIRIGGVHPFLLPALAVIPVTLERSGQSLLYALFFGLACDLLMPTGVFVCFYCLVFLAAAVIAQLLSGQVIVAGFFCSLAANAVGLLLCGLLQILLRTYQQSISTGPALMLMGKELLLSLAAHILGTIGPIWQEEWSSSEDTGYVGYADKGYSMNDLVGKDGVEKAFESYLRGTDGRRLITTDETGTITGELYTREPQPGGTVALTLDIDLQADVEAALAETISGMIDKDSNERGGAAAVVSVGTGEVLALASYPTYDLSTFNEDYDELVNDQRLPMFNRATQGIYAPGSTFKMVTAVAALESGIITPSSIIQDRGIYTYYKDPQPMCWIYSQTGSTHGRINVSQAITDSCNYFFYEVGRLTGIRTLDSYASQFGLGQSTGIEIGDSSGVLASPEWAESHDQEWTDGQTITAAIGQSYNLFTPLQLANYVATLVGGGDHYQAHLLKNVKAYDNSRLLYMYGDKPMNTVEISDSTLSAVTRGMHELTVSGSVAYAFENCVVSAGAKTGSAQVGTDIANGVFVAYAPYEKPEIAVAIVIEKGGSGAALANTAVEIINSWFSRAQDGTAIGENTLLK